MPFGPRDIRRLTQSLAPGLLAFALSACGDLSLKTTLDAAVRKQSGVDSRSLALWARSPVVDGGDPGLHAGSSLESVPRTDLDFAMLATTKSLPQSTLVSVYETSFLSLDADRPIFFDWAGTRIPWSNPAFQVFMALHHGAKAATHALGLLDDYQPASVKILAAEPGDAYSTHYSPSKKTITFYKNETGPAFNPVDEADATYHEYGHVVQHVLSPEAVAAPTLLNYQFDALQEGLSDFAAAVVARDDRTNGYLNSNTRQLAQASAVFDPAQYTRSVRNDFAFPQAWVGGLLSCQETDADCGGNGNIHQDGRVVAGALNDIRKYLSGFEVVEKNCSGANCSLKLGSGALGETKAWDEVYVLAHEAFRLMSETKTLYYYAKTLVGICSAPAFAWCTTEVKTGIKRILVGRGLYVQDDGLSAGPYAWGEFGDGNAFTTSTGATGHLRTHTAGGWFPLAGEGYANSNGVLGRCEAVFLYPNFDNVSDLRALGDRVRLAGISVEITAISGFRNLTAPSTGAVVEDVTSSAREEKFLGWMDPADTVTELISDPASRWYKNIGGSSLSAFPSLSNAYSELAWLARAPTAAGAAAGSVTYRLTLRIQNRESYEPFSVSFTQNYEVSANESFCD